MTLADLLIKAEARGCLDLALELCAWFAERDNNAPSQYETSRQAAGRSTDAAAGYGCATKG